MFENVNTQTHTDDGSTSILRVKAHYEPSAQVS